MIPKKLTNKKKKKPKTPKVETNNANISHSIINFINVGKPLKINREIHIKNDIKGTKIDKPPSSIKFLDNNCF